MLSLETRLSEINTLMDTRKPMQAPEVTAAKQSKTRYPPIGPEPLLLNHCEIDELYDLLEVLHVVLNELRIEYILIGGSLLGAVRSESILFNDYDVDIAIIDDGESYQRLKTLLPKALQRETEKRNTAQQQNIKKTPNHITTKTVYHYQERPWVVCDRVKSTAAPNVSVDVFVLRKYDTRQDLMRVIEEQQEESKHTAENKIHTSIPFESAFPLYHYDNQTAIQLKPREYFTDRELKPLTYMPFGPLNISGPSDSIGTLERFFGKDCFTHYAAVQRPSGGQSWEAARRIQLSDEQYRPVQCSRLERRIRSNHSRRALENTIALYREETEPVIITPPSSGGMSRSRSLYAFGAKRGGTMLSSMESSSLTTVESSPQLLVRPATEPQPTKWFGFDVRRHIGESPETPVFNKELRAVMEHHLRKARKKRELCRNPTDLSVDASIAGSVGVPYTRLRDERRFLFDEHSHPMHQILAETLGVEDLSQLHKHPIKDKRELLAPLLTSEGRRRFHESYEHFVTSFCIPLLHSLALTKNEFHSTSSKTAATSGIHYRYQAFPCLRVVRPGEFSIGPHCDTAYGHSIGNLNFHIPLTPVFGTNALYTESHPGKEDWHGLTTKSPGLGFLFDGARCLHFTLENTTDATRVSIDFRIAIFRGTGEGLCAKELLHDRFSNAGPGYYDEASIDSGVSSSFVAKKDGTQLFEPDARVGFPFTPKK